MSEKKLIRGVIYDDQNKVDDLAYETAESISALIDEMSQENNFYSNHFENCSYPTKEEFYIGAITSIVAHPTEGSENLIIPSSLVDDKLYHSLKRIDIGDKINYEFIKLRESLCDGNKEVCKIALTIHDKDKDIYIIVDGFHRYRCAKEYFHLKQVPIVTINKNLDDRIASTIRHNRARGTHQILDMGKIVMELTKSGWDDSTISLHLGMELDEIIKLKQVNGLKEAFANHEFSKSWEEFENSLHKD